MDFWTAARKKDAVAKAEADGLIADSAEVRDELVRKMHAGEMTLEQVQAELKRIKRDAKKNGKITRAQAWRRG
jgi:cell fate (sporulation/competence/biofilm development) regulator YlbF (YheA/YmcA/DUF963 family)